ncbi:MAG: ABC transporter ATP-binding protein, partial [Gammaproteobacteria bacterium]|nr:ABC transporter ATP-binding protein [Gammaproteobacteria bacterium]
MIQVKNLVKIYQTGDSEVKALDNVSFTLPDKGMIFIVGKSGSGKSTLLNMLGGLDDVTSGSIMIGDKDIATMTPSELDSYRNHYLSVIYQNYNLFEKETVLDNILISSAISGKDISMEYITELLEKLDVANIENKKVVNLSGGQKQRVAIARAIVKEPRLLLADEPTGNLDHKTAKVIFDILKKVSEKTLVVIISHDNDSALEYADEIIRITDGHIDSHDLRNRYYRKNTDNLIMLDETQEIDKEVISKINTALKDTDYRLGYKDKLYVKKEEDNYKEEHLELKENKFNFKLSLKSAWEFVKNNVSVFVMNFVISSLLIVLLVLSMCFASLDTRPAMKTVSRKFNMKTMSLIKGYSYTNDPNDVNSSHFVFLNDKDFEMFKDIKYRKVYSIDMYIPNSTNYNMAIGRVTKDNAFGGFYAQTGLGVVDSDMDYLKFVFGENFELAAGSLDGLESSTKLIITDYFADSILYIDKNTKKSLQSKDSNDPYQKLFNRVFNGRYEIGAIIKTNYKAQYSYLLDSIKKKSKDPNNAGAIANEVSSSQTLKSFYDDVLSRLAYGYTLNPNFYNDYINFKDFAMLNNCYILDERYEDISKSDDGADLRADDTLNPGEIKMNKALYESYFKITLDATQSNFEEKTIYIKHLGYEETVNDEGTVIDELRVVGISSTSNSEYLVNKETVEKLNRKVIGTYAIMIYDSQDIVDAYNL